MSPPIPFAPGAVREYLLAQPEWSGLGLQSTTTREAPRKITGAFVIIRAPGNVGGDPMLRRPLIQVDSFVPKLEILGGTTDPDEVAWDNATWAGWLLGRARNIDFRGSAWSARWVDGPITAVDTTRGADMPLYRAIVRAEMKIRAPHA